MNTKLNLIAILLLVFTVFACEVELQKPASRLEALVQNIVTSRMFKELGYTTGALATKDATYINESESGVYIPVANKSNAGILTTFTDSDNPTHISYFEVESELTDLELQNSMRNKTFTGIIKYRDKNGDVTWSLEKSQINKVKEETKGRCAGATSDGGPLDCAGRKINSMNWLEAGLCYSRFIICLAEQVAFCLIEGCK